MSLREIQTEFSTGVFGSFSPELAAGIVSGGLAAEQRLAIYRNNVFSNLRGALRDSYPVVLRLLGEPFFNHTADEYVRAHPSTSGDLYHFGGNFDAFLVSFEPCAELPYLPDVARLEWAWDQAFHAADCTLPALEHTLQRLATVPPEHYAGLHFSLHPSCTLLTSDYPIFRIWQVNQADYGGDQQVDLSEGGVQRSAVERHPRRDTVPAGRRWRKWGVAAKRCSLERRDGRRLRRTPEVRSTALRWSPRSGDHLALIRGNARENDFAVSILPLTAGEFAFLQAISDGSTLTAALDAALASDAGFDLGAAIHHCINQAIIVDFKSGDS